MNSLLIPDENVKDAKPWHPRPFVEPRKTDANGRTISDGAKASDPAIKQARLDQELAQIRMVAKREGLAAGLAEGKVLGQQQVVRLSQILQRVEAAFADLETSTASALIELSIDLARAVVRSELVARNDLIQPVIAEALRALPEAVTTGEIMLNPVDQDLVTAYLRDTDKLGSWRLVADPSVEAGGCRIITRSCDIDATMKTRWLRAMQTIGRTDAWLVSSNSD